MKTVQLSELGAVADDVRNGETVEIRDGDRRVATLMPVNQASLEARVQDLAARGLVRLGSGEPFPEDFFTRPLPDGGDEVLEQLLRDREQE